jgi:hypothetical protein
MSFDGGYPLLSASQVTDWPAFLERLDSGTDGAAGPRLENFWNHLEASDRRRIETFKEEPPVDLQIGICKALNSVLANPELFAPIELDEFGDPIPPRQVDAAESKGALLDNRQQLDQFFSGELRTDPKEYPGYWTIKLIYSLGYGVAMWCLVFATLGYFQERCAHYSRAWRYVADSSYWVYLAHLPLVTWLHVWIAPLPWPGLVKFLLLNVVAFTLLYASYHYLVRSTFIGRVLNGRRYPLVAFPWSRPQELAKGPSEAAV